MALTATGRGAGDKNGTLLKEKTISARELEEWWQ